MIKVGDYIFVRDHWIEHDWQVPPGKVVEIRYETNNKTPREYKLEWDGLKSEWYLLMQVKVQ